MDDCQEMHLAGGGGVAFLICFWLNLEKFCFLDNLVIFYEDHLSVARKLDAHDIWLGRANEPFLPHTLSKSGVMPRVELDSVTLRMCSDD